MKNRYLRRFLKTALTLCLPAVLCAIPAGNVSAATVTAGADVTGTGSSGGAPAVIYSPGVASKPSSADTSLTLSFVGDCSIGKLQIHGYEGTFDQYYDQFGPAYFFRNVRPVFDADDLTIANFEGVLTNSNSRVPKGYNIKGRPEFIRVIAESGIDAVSFANNHKIDYGQQGISDTIAAFDSIALPYAFDEHTALIHTDKGIDVGLVAANFVHDAEDVSHASEYLYSGIASLKARQADLIIALVHWGKEGEHFPNADQQAVGHQCIDLGADLVIGCHPHILQGAEYYKERPILYSLGNFCFGGNRNPGNKETVIAQTVLRFSGQQLQSADLRILPARLSTATDHNDYCPVLLSGAEGQVVIQHMNAYSAPFGVQFDEQGNAVR